VLKKDPTFVYLCRNGHNEELRYSIRSVLHFYPEADIWVVGGRPIWYVGNFLPVLKRGDSYSNQRKNLWEISRHPEIPEEIIIMNDDFFLQKRTNLFVYYVWGTLDARVRQYAEQGIISRYTRHLAALARYCKNHREDPLDFELHVPMPIKKSQLAHVVTKAIMWRSNYGNLFLQDYPIVSIKDVKFYNDQKHQFKEYDFLSDEYPFFSTTDKSFPVALEKYLAKNFPNPTSLEGDQGDAQELARKTALEELSKLKASGDLSNAEFRQLKGKLI
jgi:hypothetical protein